MRTWVTVDCQATDPTVNIPVRGRVRDASYKISQERSINLGDVVDLYYRRAVSSSV